MLNNPNRPSTPTPLDVASSCDAAHSALEHSLTEAECLVNDMKRVLVRSSDALEGESKAFQEMETLERWLESYRRGLRAANKLAANGTDLLKDIKNRIKLAVEEMQRLEGEGGNPANKTQAAKIESLVKAQQRLEQLIPMLEEKFPHPPLAETGEDKNSKTA